MNENLFSERLQLARMRCGITQVELAKKVGVSNTNICFYEKGKKKPSPKIATRVADVLGTSVDYLFGCVDEEGGASERSRQQKIIALKSGGRLTLTAEIDKLDMDSKDALDLLSKDWSFIYEIVDRFNAYAAGEERTSKELLVDDCDKLYGADGTPWTVG